MMDTRKRDQINESEERKMVDIKGLDKARVLKALYDHRHEKEMQGGMGITVEDCSMLLEKQTHFAYLNGRDLDVDLSGDEFDPRMYDLHYGQGAAQRAVDSIRGEKDGGDGTAKSADGEKKEPSMEEKKERVMVAVDKITNILLELSPDELMAVSAFMKILLPGSLPVSISMMAGRPFGRPFGGPGWSGRFA